MSILNIGLDSGSGFSRPVPNPGSGRDGIRDGTRELTSGRDSGRATIFPVGTVRDTLNPESRPEIPKFFFQRIFFLFV